MAYLLQAPERLQRVGFEMEYCINCAWAHGLQGKLPFLKRFSECSFCTGFRNSREVRPVAVVDISSVVALANEMCSAVCRWNRLLNIQTHLGITCCRADHLLLVVRLENLHCTAQEMYECNTELVKTFGFSNRMALGITGCGQGGGKGESINPTDPGPRPGGSSSSSSASSGASIISQHLQMATSEASGPNPVMAFASFMRTHFFTMAFVGVFFASFVHRGRRRRQSS